MYLNTDKKNLHFINMFKNSWLFFIMYFYKY